MTSLRNLCPLWPLWNFPGFADEGAGKLPEALGKGLGLIGQNMRSDRVSMTKKCQTGLGLVVGLGNGQLDCILIGDSAEGFGDTTDDSGMHKLRSERSGLGSGVVEDCSGEFGLSLDTTRVCLGPLGCHGYGTLRFQEDCPESSHKVPEFRCQRRDRGSASYCTLQ